MNACPVQCLRGVVCPETVEKLAGADEVEYRAGTISSAIPIVGYIAVRRDYIAG